MAIEIVDFPMKNGGSFHSYVKLPEGNDCYSSRHWSHGPVEIVDLPIDSMVDRSTSQTVNVYQRLPASHSLPGVLI